LKQENEKYNDLTIDYKSKINDEVLNLKRTFFENIGEINKSVGEILSHHEYNLARFEKHKVNILIIGPSFPNIYRSGLRSLVDQTLDRINPNLLLGIFSNKSSPKFLIFL
jgi:hypothetical protein